MDWFSTAALGEVRLSANKRIFDPRKILCFSDVMNRAERLEVGSTHVAIGFVDLGQLREAEFFPTDAASLLPSTREPVRWVGLEASPYCVAKTIVITTMLKMQSPADCILQVWYSAAWSSVTVKAFRRAVTSALTTDMSDHSGVHHEEVRVLLRHWQTASVILDHARQGWLDSAPDMEKWRLIGNFTGKVDRLALCTYLLTGQLLPATEGSVTFFSFPSDYWGKNVQNQYFFESLPLDCVFQERKSAGCGDVLSAAISYIRGGIEKLQNQIIQGNLIVDIRLLVVEPKNPRSMAEIAALDPHSIYWSNVCDYYSAEEFHSMARACSGKNTVHSAYSTNWPSEVKGLSLDSVIPEDMNGISDDNLSSALAQAMSGYSDYIHGLYVTHSYCEFMRSPPVGDPRNVIEFGTCWLFKDNWVKTFFTRGDISNDLKTRYIVTDPLYTPFNRSQSTIYFTFAYDPTVTFNLNPTANLHDDNGKPNAMVDFDVDNPPLQTIVQDANNRMTSSVSTGSSSSGTCRTAKRDKKKRK